MLLKELAFSRGRAIPVPVHFVHLLRIEKDPPDLFQVSAAPKTPSCMRELRHAWDALAHELRSLLPPPLRGAPWPAILSEAQNSTGEEFDGCMEILRRDADRILSSENQKGKGNPLPLKPHPACVSFATHGMPSRTSFARCYRAGDPRLFLLRKNIDGDSNPTTRHALACRFFRFLRSKNRKR